MQLLWSIFLHLNLVQLFTGVLCCNTSTFTCCVVLDYAEANSFEREGLAFRDGRRGGGQKSILAQLWKVWKIPRQRGFALGWIFIDVKLQTEINGKTHSSRLEIFLSYQEREKLTIEGRNFYWEQSDKAEGRIRPAATAKGGDTTEGKIVPILGTGSL